MGLLVRGVGGTDPRSSALSPPSARVAAPAPTRQEETRQPRRPRGIIGELIVKKRKAEEEIFPGKMADLEAVLADVSYLMAMEKSKSTPAARASKKIILPEPR